eukprot:2353568-Heterocapsa_arctica.AAC.1
MELAANVSTADGELGANVVKAEIKLYIALSATDAVKVNTEGCLHPNLFGGSYIPLKVTKEDAVQTALEARNNSAAMMAAMWPS